MANSKTNSSNDSPTPPQGQQEELASNGKESDDSEKTEPQQIKEEELDNEQQLKIALEEANTKVDENWELYLRAKADLDNARKRAQQDIEKARKYGLEKIVEDLIPVKDSMEMGRDAAQADDADLAKLREGSELILKMLSDTVEKYGIETLDPKGDVFNPEVHQAMSIQESDNDQPNTVMAVMQKGYLLNGRLIRPALVIVSKKPAGKNKNNGTENNQKVGTNVDEKA